MEILFKWYVWWLIGANEGLVFLLAFLLRKEENEGEREMVVVAGERPGFSDVVWHCYENISL